MADLPFNGSFWSNVDKVLRHLDGVYSRAIKDLNLDIIEAYILWSLNEQNGQRPSDLARTVNRGANSFTPILDKLERKALIARRSNTADRRSVRIILTPAGEKLSRQAASRLQATDETLKRSIGAEQLPNFLRVVRVLQHISTDTESQKQKHNFRIG